LRNLQWTKHEEVKVFSTLTHDIRFLADYLHEHKVKKVAMESTGIYWIPIWNIRITSFVSKIASKSVQKVIQLIISGETDLQKLVNCIHGRIKNEHQEKIHQSLDGVVP